MESRRSMWAILQVRRIEGPSRKLLSAGSQEQAGCDMPDGIESGFCSDMGCVNSIVDALPMLPGLSRFVGVSRQYSNYYRRTNLPLISDTPRGMLNEQCTDFKEERI